MFVGMYVCAKVYIHIHIRRIPSNIPKPNTLIEYMFSQTKRLELILVASKGKYACISMYVHMHVYMYITVCKRNFFSDPNI